jgi:hypothetical protein
MASRQERTGETGRTGKRRPVLGLFRNREEAEGGLRDLQAAGFRDDQVSVLMRDRDQAGKGAADTADRDRERVRDLDTDRDTGRGDKVSAAAAAGLSDPAAGVAKGAVAGAGIGGLLGLLTALLIPGAGPLLVGGVIASTLVGMGVGAATGGLVGLLASMGATDEEAQYFNRGVEAGGILILVEPGERPNEARIILEEAGADVGPTPVAEIDIVPTDATEPWRGNERRFHDDAAYTGPERRMART